MNKLISLPLTVLLLAPIATRVLPPYQEGQVCYTRSKNGRFSYAICKQWPGKQLTLKGVKASRNATITLLGVEKPLAWRQSQEGLVIELPDALQDEKARPYPSGTRVR